MYIVTCPPAAVVLNFGADGQRVERRRPRRPEPLQRFYREQAQHAGVVVLDPIHVAVLLGLRRGVDPANADISPHRHDSRPQSDCEQRRRRKLDGGAGKRRGHPPRHHGSGCQVIIVVIIVKFDPSSTFFSRRRCLDLFIPRSG